MSCFDSYIDFGSFDHFDQISNGKSTKIVTSQKTFCSSQKYIFKIFQFECTSSKDQKIILDTFYQISKKKNQYLQSYKYLSFSFESNLQPTLAMKYISSKTLEHVLRNPDLLKKLSIEEIIQCLFAVAEGMSYLHSHLIYHGNLCPSNIIIDEANQCYLCDFGLYPIKKLYVKEEFLFNQIYKDPYMKNNQPAFINDIYSFGVLMCDIYISYLQATNNMKQEETLQSFLKNTNKNKFDSFPSIFAKIIPLCLNSFASERPSFGQLIRQFESSNENIQGVNLQQLYQKFINSNYLLNLAEKDDPNALNKVGNMYENGKIFQKDHQKAMEFFEKAANLNNSEAQNNYGVLLQENADKNKADLIKGANYLQLSAEQGNIHGMANYAMALLNGDGVQKNYQKAEEYLQKSADLGYSYAQIQYGSLLLDNNPSIHRINEGLSYIKKAIDQKDPEAYCALAKLLQKGKFVEQNINLAMEYFKIAADMGLEEAMIEYANYYYNGDVNSAKNSLKYYQMAFDKGNTSVKNKIDKLKEKLEGPKKELKSPNKNKSFSNENDEIISLSNRISTRSSKTQKNSTVTFKENDKYSDESYDDNDDYNKPRKQKKNNYNVMNYDKYIQFKRMLKNNIPISISKTIRLISLGTIVYDRLNFHNANYIYPVGFQSEKDYNSIEDPKRLATYRSTIVDGDDGPIFRVECLDSTNKVFEGHTTSTAWSEVIAAIEKTKKTLKIKTRRATNISGPEKFGLSNNNITYMIERLPNAKLCSNYIFKTLSKNNNDDEIEEKGDEEGGEEEEEEEEEENDQINSFDPNLPTDKLIKQGELFFEKNNLLDSFKCYKELVNRGKKEMLLKCAETCQSIEEKLEFLEQAIKEQIPSSFSKWRIAIMRRVFQTDDNEILNNYAKRFEKFNDFSDASIVYNKAKDILNSQICYEKAKQNLDNINDGYQQFDFANLIITNHKDLEIAKIMLQKAKENNISKADSKLKKIDHPKSPKQLTEVESILQEGINYYEGLNGQTKNVEKAMIFFEKASKIGCPKADFYIGKSNLNELGVESLKKSAEAGDPDGQNRYAYYLKNGIIVPKDEERAIHFYKLSADQGHAEASYEYGREKYKKGITEEERKEGIEYLKKSAEKLFPDGIYMYSKICKQYNPEEAQKLYEFAIEKGSRLALKDQSFE